MRFDQLDQWLAWQETLHPAEIELGLDRIRQVFQRLRPQAQLPVVITVAGTNGKGSAIAMLEAILLADGYRVGKYTSPHLYRYNERIQVDRRVIDDASLCAAFERVDQARGDTSLTYFEFGTLAALDTFHTRNLDVVLLETGLGGRLDAVNIVDADVSLVTSIDLDHTDWLGDTREAIAREKLGIARPQRPCVIADPEPPGQALADARAQGVKAACIGHEFGYTRGGADIWYWHDQDTRMELALPALRGEHQLRNASGVIMALRAIHSRLPVSAAAIRTGLADATLAGRFSISQQGRLTVIQDVAHNPAAASELARNLFAMTTPGDRYGVFAAMADKDLEGILQPLLPYINQWYLPRLTIPRAASVEQLRSELVKLGVDADRIHSGVEPEQAWQSIQAHCAEHDQVVVFGSFYTLEAMAPVLNAPAMKGM